MKQISQNYKSGALKIETVGEPVLRAGSVRVRSLFSAISPGTEGMKVREAKMSLVEKARARPDQVRKVLQTVQQQGLVSTYHKVMNKLDSLTPLGYSVSGIVEAVGERCPEFEPGQRVACGGAGLANHAEINVVPRNLAVPVPENVDMGDAAFATIGAIALQGVRQAGMQLGETACVIGLGLIGQLVVQLLRASGVRVIGIDPVPSRCDLATACGAEAAFAPNDAELPAAVKRATQHAGSDALFLTAGGNTNQPVELAASLARDRARVVDIGKMSLDFPWKDYYEKELDVRFSRSYGPGRYDPEYEERGLDYPIGYVRWTERRNMAAFLDLLAQKKLTLKPLISGIHPFAEAETVYAKLAEGNTDILAVLFAYDTGTEQPLQPHQTSSRLRKTAVSSHRTPECLPASTASAANAASGVRWLDTASNRTGSTARPLNNQNQHSASGDGASSRTEEERRQAAALQNACRHNQQSELPGVANRPQLKSEKLRLGVIGAGNYACSMLLPHLAANKAVELYSVATTTGLSAENARRKFGFRNASTDADTLLADPEMDAVIIATRHASHPHFVIKALRAGKSVFVEKPLAIDTQGLRDVLQAMEESGNDQLQVGFNRRFCPAMRAIGSFFAKRSGPLSLLYRVHAGSMAGDSWYRDPTEGGRFVGEAGHFLDVFGYLTGARPVWVQASDLSPASVTADDRENLSVVIRYADGSTATLLYLTQGGVKVPKEYLEAHADGRSAIMDNFERLRFFEDVKARTKRLGPVNKGQCEEMQAFVDAARGAIPWPFTMDSLIETTALTLAAQTAARKGQKFEVLP